MKNTDVSKIGHLLDFSLALDNILSSYNHFWFDVTHML